MKVRLRIAARTSYGIEILDGDRRRELGTDLAGRDCCRSRDVRESPRAMTAPSGCSPLSKQGAVSMIIFAPVDGGDLDS